MSSVSEVDAVNLALGWLGAKLVTSLQDDSTEGKLVNANYFMLRDAVMEEVDWRFAQKRIVIPLSADKPAYGFANQFLIPPDVLKVIEVNENRYDWQREGRFILTDEGRCEARTLVKVVDPLFWSDLFVQALAARVAMDLAMPLTQNRSLQSDMASLYGTKITEAKASDGQQGKGRRVRMRHLHQARLGGGQFFGPQVWKQ